MHIKSGEITATWPEDMTASISSLVESVHAESHSKRSLPQQCFCPCSALGDEKLRWAIHQLINQLSNLVIAIERWLLIHLINDCLFVCVQLLGVKRTQRR